jgi:hypothetical protein
MRRSVVLMSLKRKVLIKGGLNYILDLYSQFKLEILSYNEKIKDTGYYVKPMHIAYKNSDSGKVKYIYFGRYWYRVIKRDDRLVWVYVGKDKPEPSLPEPPPNPFERVSIAVVNDSDIEVGLDSLELLANIEKHTNKSGVFIKALDEAQRSKQS